MSLHSPLSPSSERSDPAYDGMLPPQRVIERMSSYPSLSQSSTTATSDDPHDMLVGGEVMTPVDASIMGTSVKIQDEEQELLSPVHDGRRGLGGFSKSMQSLRGKAKSDRERSRSTSRERPPVPLVEPGLKVSAANRPTQPIPIPSSKAQAPAPVRPKPQRSGSSFSSFIRKLTGKSSKPASPSPPVQLAPAPATRVSRDHATTKRPSPPSPPSRKPTLAIDTGNNLSSARPSHFRKTSLPLDIVAPVPDEMPMEPAPLTAPPRAPTIVLFDPRTVPLPPSPPSPAVVLPDEEALDFSLSPTSYERATAASLTLQRSTEEAIVEEESADEEDDIVNPLPSSSPQPSGRISTSPVSTSTINDPDVRTPLSPSFPQNRERASPGSALDGTGSSPPRDSQAFGGNSMNGRTETLRMREPPAGNLGRKESKWRKSVMNLSETLNGQSKRVSKAPPTSFDAYQQHQARMANNRRSCAPTLHSTGTVSAEIRQIKDKEQQDMADTFFLS